VRALARPCPESRSALLRGFCSRPNYSVEPGSDTPFTVRAKTSPRFRSQQFLVRGQCPQPVASVSRSMAVAQRPASTTTGRTTFVPGRGAAQGPSAATPPPRAEQLPVAQNGGRQGAAPLPRFSSTRSEGRQHAPSQPCCRLPLPSRHSRHTRPRQFCKPGVELPFWCPRGLRIKATSDPAGGQGRLRTRPHLLRARVDCRKRPVRGPRLHGRRGWAEQRSPAFSPTRRSSRRSDRRVGIPAVATGFELDA